MRTISKMTKKALSVLLAAAMVIGTLSVSKMAYAEEEPELSKMLVLNAMEHPTAYASTGDAPAAIDGNPDSRWESAFNDAEWIYVDLGEFYNVVKVDLSWETAASQVYEIQVSDDAETWTTVKTITDGAQGEFREIVFNPVSARYVKINCLKRATGWGNSLWEINIYHAADRDFFEGRNLAFHADAFASSIENAGNAAASAVDGNLNTKWGSVWENITEEQKNNQWFMVDLGRDFLLDNVYLIWQGNAAYGKAYEVQISVDGTTWETVFTEMEGDGGTDTVTLDQLRARYVKMQGIERGTTYGYSLNEFEVYGSLYEAPEEEEPEEPFYSDVEEDTWYYPYIKEATELGLVSGYEDNTFKPEETMNRAMIVTVLHRIFDYPVVEYTDRFTDVAADEYYTTAVMWAAQNRIVNGYSDNTFGPNKTATREQLAVMLMNFAKNLGLDVSGRVYLGAYVDGDQISAYARPAMGWALANGIMSGNAKKVLTPTNNVTRAEATKMILNFYKLLKAQGE